MAARRISILAFDGVQSIDVFGPLEVLATADRVAGGGAYAVELIADGDGPLCTSSGARLLPDRSLALRDGALDTLIVAGGDGVRATLEGERLAPWIGRAASHARRVCSVCTGAFLLAQAGLLDGRRATTHWSACAELARRHPAVEVEHDPIFVRDGPVTTSAGVTAGIDLALALVEEDLGAAVARDVARWLVLFLRRPGGQSQFSVQLERPTAAQASLRDLQGWISGNLDADLSVAALAERAAISPRHFARVFRAELGVTPAAYVESVRLERARDLLESGEDLPVEAIAARCGFGTVETLRRSFGRAFGASPSAYRERFRPGLSAA